MPIQPQLTILIVDDEARSATNFAEQLEEALSRQRDMKLPADLRINVECFVPLDQENFQEFADRFLEHITSCDRESTGDASQIKMIIFDYQFRLLGGTSGNLRGRTGTHLAELARRRRPDILRLLYTQYRLSDIAVEERSLFDYREEKGNVVLSEEFDNFAMLIVDALSERLATPFFSALWRFAKTRKTVMHALAISDSQILKNSWTLRKCLDFYNDDFFRSEASSTDPPLDSIFNPTTSLAAALKSYAKAFGADGVLFCTAGTSTANKFVYQAYCRKRDWVLIDRNCHISHHYSIALTGAKVCYVDAVINNRTENPVAALPVSFLQVLDQQLAAGERPPRVVSTTNCTFDGSIVDIEMLVSGIWEILRKNGKEECFEEIVFLIDEAWFGFAYCHPTLTEYSAMSVARRLQRSGEPWARARIYATTSVHKTMFGIRQASVLLSADLSCVSKLMGHELSNSNGQKIERAFFTFTSTSPNLGILASLDLCAQHMWLEGMSAVQSAIDAANYFKERFEEGISEGDEPLAKYFILEQTDLRDIAHGGVISIDPTKISIVSRGGHTGFELKKSLWSNGLIQVNKFGSRDVLFMFMPGFDQSKADALLQGLYRVVEKDVRFRTVIDRNAAAPAVPAEREVGVSQLIDIGKPLYDWSGAKAQHCFYVGSDNGSTLDEDHVYLSADFVTPYPPGYPALVPGEVLNANGVSAIAERLGTEVHGLRKDEKGYFISVYRSRRK